MLFDGLGLFSKIIDYQRLHSLERVISELRSSLRANTDSSSYTSLLSNYDRTFKDFAAYSSASIPNVIPDEEALRDFLDYSGVQSETSEIRVHKIPSKLTLEQARLNLSSLESLKKQVELDTNQLVETRSILSDTSAQWDRGLVQREVETRSRYNSQIEEIRPDVERQVAEFQSSMNYELQRIENRHSPHISELQDELARLENRERRERNDYGYVSNRTKRQADSVRSELHSARNERAEAVANTERHYNQLIRDQLYRIKSLEQRRDAEISSLENARSQISTLQKKVDQRLSKLHEKKTLSLQEIDRINVLLPNSLETRHSAEESFWFTFPLLVARYEGGKDNKTTRWEIFPPLALRKKSKLVDSIKKLFGGFPLPVEPRTEKFERVLSARFEKALESDKNLSVLISEIGSNHNILQLEGVGERIELGLNRLLNEGWLKPKQFDEIKVELESLIGRKIEPWNQELPPSEIKDAANETQESKSAVEFSKIPTVKFVLQTKDRFGTNYSPKKWLSILDDSNDLIDLEALGYKTQNYFQQGYLNLLAALYDSNKEDLELEQRIKNDSWTRYMLFFLRNLKSKGQVEYDPNGSEYPTIKPILEKLLIQGESSEDISPDGSHAMKRQLSFNNSLGDSISIVRETLFSKTDKAEKIIFRLKP